MKNTRNCGQLTSRVFRSIFFQICKAQKRRIYFQQNEPFYDESKWTVLSCCPWLTNVNLINHKNHFIEHKIRMDNEKEFFFLKS